MKVAETGIRVRAPRCFRPEMKCMVGGAFNCDLGYEFRGPAWKSAGIAIRDGARQPLFSRPPEGEGFLPPAYLSLFLGVATTPRKEAASYS